MLQSRAVGSRVAVAFATLLAPVAAADADAQQPERAPAHVDTIHGVAVGDPYRWLEELDSVRIQRWIRDQDASARRRIAAMPSREATRATIAAIGQVDTYGAPVKEGGRYFVARFPALRRRVTSQTG